MVQGPDRIRLLPHIHISNRRFEIQDTTLGTFPVLFLCFAVVLTYLSGRPGQIGILLDD